MKGYSSSTTIIGAIAFLLFVVWLSSCSKEEDSGTTPFPYEKLSQYHFFTGDMKDLNPGDRVLPYDLNTPLFSDYALKARFFYMPEGVSANYTAEGPIDFPVGAILIKNFFYREDFRNNASPRKIIETRLLIREETKWESATYLWDDAQQEAYLSVIGKQTPVSWIDLQGNPRSANYTVPNKNDCKGCHSYNNELIPIGPKARNLNRMLSYDDGTMNQLQKWSEAGFLSGWPGILDVPLIADWQDTTVAIAYRARAYLDVNCGHCHNPQGPANNSGLTLTYEEVNPTHLGFCKPPVAAGQGSGGLKYAIVPGKPDESIMVYRMSSTKPDVAMPELGKTLAHDEGVQLISDWIASLPGSCD